MHINDIAGIGLDTGSMLNQPRSRSSSPEALVTIGNASDQQDREFLIWGHNAGDRTATTPITVGNRALRRLQRTWFVDKTGDPGTVSIGIDTTDIPALATPAPGEAYRLLIADDSEFSNAQIIDIGNVPGPVTAPAVNIDDGQYFTFGVE